MKKQQAAAAEEEDEVERNFLHGGVATLRRSRLRVCNLVKSVTDT